MPKSVRVNSVSNAPITKKQLKHTMESQGGGKGSISKALLKQAWHAQGPLAIPHFHYVKSAPAPLPGKRQGSAPIEHETEIQEIEFEMMKNNLYSDWDPNHPYEYHIRHPDGSVTTYKAKVTFGPPRSSWTDWFNPLKAVEAFEGYNRQTPTASQKFYRYDYNQGAGFEPAASGQQTAPHNASGPFTPTAIDTYRPAHRPETNQSAGSAEPVTGYAPAVQFNAPPAPAGPSSPRPWLSVSRAGSSRGRAYKPLPLRKQWWAQLSSFNKRCIRNSKWWQRRSSDLANQRRWNSLTPGRQMALLRSC